MPCTLITPIAPHTLSFRPVVVPEASDFVIHLSGSSRAHARRASCTLCTLRAPADRCLSRTVRTRSVAVRRCHVRPAVASGAHAHAPGKVSRWG